MSRITDLKRRLFIIVGSIVFIMVAVILLFNLRLLHESMQQTRQNHKRTLQMYTAMFSDAMDQIEDMLISQNIEDVDMQNIRRPRNETDRYLALLDKKQFFAEEIGKYQYLDGLFLYDTVHKNYIGVKSELVSMEMHTTIKESCRDIIENYRTASRQSEWMYLKVQGEYYLFRLVHWKQIYYCAWLKPENMLAELQEAGREDGKYYYLSDREGHVLNQVEGINLPVLTGATVEISGETYDVLSEERDGLTLSVVSERASWVQSAGQILLPVGSIIVMGGAALALVLLLTSEIVMNPLYDIFVEEERKKNQAKLQFLQIQTNPHFLNNCLSLIRNLILLDRKEEAERVILILGKYTRGYLNAETEITLETEMNQVNGYYELQKMRYGERFKLDVYMDEGLENVLVPAMSVLTFVENAVKHQMKMKETLYVLVWVRRNPEKKQVILRVQDNGEGFSDRILRQLKCTEEPEEHDGDKKDKGHIGIKNLIQRIRLLYGQEAEIYFENAETGGAVITMIFPERK